MRRIFTVFLLFFVLPFGATAQTELDETRAFLGWSMEVNQVTQRALGLLDSVFDADIVGVRVRDGEIDVEAGEAELATWRNLIDAELLAIEAEVARLSSGPAAVPERLAPAVGAMVSSLHDTVAAVNELVDQAEAAARRDFAGEPENDDAIYAARYAALQEYYAGQARYLRLTAELAEAEHPQYGLSLATATNLDSIVIALELGRQAFGDEPSAFAVSDPAVTFADNAASVEAHLDESERQYRTMRAQVMLMSTGSSEEERIRTILLDMLETYVESYAAERRGLGLHRSLIGDIEARGSDAVFDWVEHLIGYEEERDGVQQRRMAIASQL